MRDYTVKIIIATHKKYQMPKDDMYLPLHVGAEGKLDENGNDLDLGYTKDNSGDNISNLNASFCELTGLYWAWKNIDADYIGLAHYRRHFSLKKKAGFENVLTYSELKPYLGKIKVFVPNKRKYYIETLYSHYEHTHYKEQLDETRNIILEKYPDYVSIYDKVVKRTYATVFSILFHKPFYVFGRKTKEKNNNMETRIDTLLSCFGLQNCMGDIENPNCLPFQLDGEKIDWILEERKKTSLDFLKASLDYNVL